MLGEEGVHASSASSASSSVAVGVCAILETREVQRTGGVDFHAVKAVVFARRWCVGSRGTTGNIGRVRVGIGGGAKRGWDVERMSRLSDLANLQMRMRVGRGDFVRRRRVGHGRSVGASGIDICFRW